MFHVCLACFIREHTSCSAEHVTGFIDTNMSVFEFIFIATVNGMLSVSAHLSLCVKGAGRSCVQMHYTGESTL